MVLITSHPCPFAAAFWGKKPSLARSLKTEGGVVSLGWIRGLYASKPLPGHSGLGELFSCLPGSLGLQGGEGSVPTEGIIKDLTILFFFFFLSSSRMKILEVSSSQTSQTVAGSCLLTVGGSTGHPWSEDMCLWVPPQRGEVETLSTEHFIHLWEAPAAGRPVPGSHSPWLCLTQTPPGPSLHPRTSSQLS